MRRLGQVRGGAPPGRRLRRPQHCLVRACACVLAHWWVRARMRAQMAGVVAVRMLSRATRPESRRSSCARHLTQVVRVWGQPSPPPSNPLAIPVAGRHRARARAGWWARGRRSRSAATPRSTSSASPPDAAAGPRHRPTPPPPQPLFLRSYHLRRVCCSCAHWQHTPRPLAVVLRAPRLCSERFCPGPGLCRPESLSESPFSSFGRLW